MKAWLWDGSAGMHHLRLAEAPTPVPKQGEVVMEIHYAALNPADRYLAERRYPYPVNPPLPHVLGRDGVGTVIQVGEGVNDVRVGDRRVGYAGGGVLIGWCYRAEIDLGVDGNLFVQFACKAVDIHTRVQIGILGSASACHVGDFVSHFEVAFVVG